MVLSQVVNTAIPLIQPQQKNRLSMTPKNDNVENLMGLQNLSLSDMSTNLICRLAVGSEGLRTSTGS